MPAATGARLARGRGRPIVLVGDGSFQMTGMDLSTAVAHGLDPIVLVLDNHGYGAERAIVDGPFNDVARWDYTLAGATVPSARLLLETPIVTLAVGWLFSATVNVAVPPASVVVTPAVGFTVTPATSSSMFVTTASGGSTPL